MATETAGADTALPGEASLALQSVYLKDCSYESPNGPRMEGNWNPQINLDLQTGSAPLRPQGRGGGPTAKGSAKYGEATIFLVEVKQAGLFVIRNFTEEDTKRAVSTYCPGVLFPYARAAISHLVTQGGFPQFLLPPVNLEALYAANQQPPPTTN